MEMLNGGWDLTQIEQKKVSNKFEYNGELIAAFHYDYSTGTLKTEYEGSLKEFFGSFGIDWGNEEEQKFKKAYEILAKVYLKVE